MNKIKQLLVLLSLLVSFPIYAKPASVVKKAIGSSVMIVVKDQGSGSGFAVSQQGDQTLIMTNDHVCQMTRGKVSLSHKVDYSSKLNTLEIEAVDSNYNVYKGRVVKTSNVHLLKKGEKGSDLCLISIEGRLPIAQFSSEGLEIGDKIFSVGAPQGIYPLVNEGFVGATYLDEDNLKEVRITSLLLWSGSSGSAAYSSETGLVVGVVFAILPVSEKIEVPIVTLIVPGDQAKAFLNNYLKKAI